MESSSFAESSVEVEGVCIHGANESVREAETSIHPFPEFKDKHSQIVLSRAYEAVKKNFDRELSVSFKGALSRLYRARVGEDLFVILKGHKSIHKSNLIASEARILEKLGRQKGVVECYGTISVRREGEVEIKDAKGDPIVPMYLVLEYAAMSSVTLGTIGASFEAREKFTLLREVAEALKCIHAKDIVHLDLKPENILMVLKGKYEEGKVESILADFGLSVFLDGREVVMLGGRCGTYKYAAYEQSSPTKEANFCGKFSDVFSFAAIVVFVLLGHHNINWKRKSFDDAAKNPPFDEECLNIFPEEFFKHENLDIRTMIKDSWERDYRKRPTIEKWVEMIKIHETNASTNSAKYEFARGGSSILDVIASVTGSVKP
eukprot:TRINITY_DN82813_c0_g1_i1.p1 TRINITY_DN82813_c0_g1~~TRINITY_DN82813_c0_g1_i1.p1  ORF type:complete len:376 (-),score=93.07 TRINITY_DN82813_c0_g1_i1:99-1226(-)